MKKVVIFKILILLFIALVNKYSLEAKHTTRGIQTPELKFQLEDYGDPFDPLSYVPYEDTIHPTFSCPGTDYICIIDVYESEVYTLADIPIPAYWGKPKVNSGILRSDITYALASFTNPYISGTARFIRKRD
jgi:hypothetical protein